MLFGDGYIRAFFEPEGFGNLEAIGKFGDFWFGEQVTQESGNFLRSFEC